MFMKSEISRLKAVNPELEHRAAFTLAAKNWGESKENPKNK